MINELNNYFIPDISEIIFNFFSQYRINYNKVILQLKLKFNKFCNSCLLKFEDMKAPIYFHYICCSNNYCKFCFYYHQKQCSNRNYL